MDKLSMYLKTPVGASVITLLVTFGVATLYFYVTKPDSVCKMNEDGEKVIDIGKLLTYSAIVSVIFALIVVVSKYYTSKTSSSSGGSVGRFGFGCGCA